MPFVIDMATALASRAPTYKRRMLVRRALCSRKHTPA